MMSRQGRMYTLIASLRGAVEYLEDLCRDKYSVPLCLPAPAKKTTWSRILPGS
jgi:hypothetical protein